MKIHLLLIGLIIVSLPLFGQESKVPLDVQDEFKKLYPKAAEVKWDVEDKDKFEAEFREGEKSISVVMNQDGKLVEKETEIDIKDLPAAASAYIMSNYKDYKITEASKIIDNNNIITFEAEISEGTNIKDLLFDKDGSYLSMDDSDDDDEDED